MHEIIVDSKIQAIEAALKLAEKRQLPALRNAAAVETFAGHGEHQKVAVRHEDLALTLLWRMEQRVAEMEDKRTLDDAWQKTLDTTQGEHAEAIELIGKEVAALKKQAQKIERHLSIAQLEAHQRRAGHNPWSGAVRVLVFTALLGALVLILLAINR